MLTRTKLVLSILLLTILMAVVLLWPAEGHDISEVPANPPLQFTSDVGS